MDEEGRYSDGGPEQNPCGGPRSGAPEAPGFWY